MDLREIDKQLLAAAEKGDAGAVAQWADRNGRSILRHVYKSRKLSEADRKSILRLLIKAAKAAPEGGHSHS